MKKYELFEPNIINHKNVIISKFNNLYKQERDWTCSIACIRTLISSHSKLVRNEIYFISKYDLKPGPYYSKDIKKIGILKKYDAIYGCDNENTTLDTILDLMKNGYSVMVESMYNYAHWFVILGYYPLLNADVEINMILIYDPYYNEVRLLRVDEFINMWIDGDYANTKVEKDFIAIKKR